jgi:cytidyltransferase-like protein
MYKYKIGAIHGRFQPFHNGHMEYFKQAKEQCEKIVVGITNPDPKLTGVDSTNLNRSELRNNPFSYWQRYEIITSALLEEGYSREEFDIVPFPINFPELIQYYVPKDAIHFTRIFEPWNHKKVELLRAQGHELIILFDGTEEDKKVVGTNVRNKIINKEDYSKDLPKGTIKALIELDLLKLIK